MKTETCFNKKEWEKLIQSPDWYLSIAPKLDELRKARQKNRDYYETCKESVYDFFEQHLAKGDIALGSSGPNMDEDRKPIDTVVIHHTSVEKPLTKNRLSAMGLLLLYARYYFNPYYEGEENMKGQPIYSGHFRNEKQVFWAYHWIVRKDGSVERLLNDDEVGWHAGNHNVNARSIAIVLDNDYENSTPSNVELEAVADIINKNYPQTKRGDIIGHREVKRLAKGPGTTCPGKQFLGGWKDGLLEKLEK